MYCFSHEGAEVIAVIFGHNKAVVLFKATTTQAVLIRVEFSYLNNVHYSAIPCGERIEYFSFSAVW